MRTLFLEKTADGLLDLAIRAKALSIRQMHPYLSAPDLFYERVADPKFSTEIATAPRAFADKQNLFFGEFRGASMLTHHVPTVILTSAEKEVIGVDTPTIVAGMTNTKVGRDRPPMELP